MVRENQEKIKIEKKSTNISYVIISRGVRYRLFQFDADTSFLKYQYFDTFRYRYFFDSDTTFDTDTAFDIDTNFVTKNKFDSHSGKIALNLAIF